MPRVTQAYRDRQTDRILRAAEACFARGGFRATSMDQIISEVGMSSSTVYRYFPQGKNSLICAVIERTTDPMVQWLDEAAAAVELPPPREAFFTAVGHCLEAKGLSGDGAAERSGVALIVFSWAELSSDPVLRGLTAERFTRIRSQIKALILRWQQAGRLDDQVDAATIAMLFHHLVLGLIVDRIVSDVQGLEGAEPMIDGLLDLLEPRPGTSHDAQMIDAGLGRGVRQ